MFLWLWSHIANDTTTKSHITQSRKKKSSKNSVRFSPSTLHYYITKQLNKLSSTNPYLNFLMVHNIREQKLDADVEGVQFYDIRRSTECTRELWRNLREEERWRYYEMALDARKRLTMNFDKKRVDEKAKEYWKQLDLLNYYDHEDYNYNEDDTGWWETTLVGGRDNIEALLTVMCLRLLLSYRTHLKIVLVLTLLKNIYLIESPCELYLNYFKRDIINCPNCYKNQYDKCLKLYEKIEPSNGLYDQLFSSLQLFNKKRNFNWLTLKQTKAKIIAKTYQIRNQSRLSQNVSTLSNDLQGRFPILGGFNYCTVNAVNSNSTSSAAPLRLVAYFEKRGYTERAILLYMLENVTPLIMPEFDSLELPVPQVHAACGFSIFQVNAGRTLSYYRKSEFLIRLHIAKQLMKLALQFSYGFDHFRIYLTDLTVDNLAFDEATQKLALIDLDTIIIVDAQDVAPTIHRYEIIQSSNNFAYDPHEFCKSGLYDINIYAACHLLREDLLQAIPAAVLKEHPNVITLLNECETCPLESCKERFQLADQLLKLFDQMLLG